MHFSSDDPILLRNSTLFNLLSPASGTSDKFQLLSYKSWQETTGQRKTRGADKDCMVDIEVAYYWPWPLSLKVKVMCQPGLSIRWYNVKDRGPVNAQISLTEMFMMKCDLDERRPSHSSLIEHVRERRFSTFEIKKTWFLRTEVGGITSQRSMWRHACDLIAPTDRTYLSPM